MSFRLDLGPLISAVRDGLRHRGPQAEKPDRLTRTLLIAIPLVSFAVSIVFGLKLETSGALITAFALLAGVLLAAFTQLASWRSQLSARSAIYQEAEFSARRAIDEAVAHTLWASFLSVTATIFSLIAESSLGLEWACFVIPRIFSAGVVAIGVYLTLTLTIIVNLLWDGYVRATQNEEAQARAQREEKQ